MKNIRNFLVENKIVAVIRTNSCEEAREISLAAIDGGIKIIEVTMSVPNAPLLIKELKAYNKDVLIGAGTVLTKENLKDCVDNNADFIVSPCMDDEILSYAKELNVVAIPGVMTMTELNQAYKQGVNFIKIFPGNIVGKEMIKAAKSIFPDITIMPTGGVNDQNINEWIDAGADCVGIGSDLNRIYKSHNNTGVVNYCKELTSR